MIHYLKLIRPVNLLVIIFTLWVMRFKVEFALIQPWDFVFALSDTLFWILVASVVLIAAGGNVINDYFDTKVDSINHPEQVIIGNTISRRSAMTLHMVLSSLGFILGVYIAYKAEHISFAMFHLFAIVSLYFYSVYLKKIVVLGNFVVALLAGAVPLLYALFEVPLLIQFYVPQLEEVMKGSDFQPADYFQVMLYWFVGFGAFAFLLNFSREIIKDIQDYSGDKAIDRRTLPVVYGARVTNWIVLVLNLIIIVALFWVYKSFINHNLSIQYLLIAVVLPVLVSALLLFYEKPNALKWSSWLMKIAMVGGLCFAFLIDNILGL